MLDVDIQASNLLSVVFGLVFSILGCALLCSELPWPWMLLGLCLLCIYGVRFIQRQALRCLQASVTRLQHSAEGWCVTLRSGEVLEVQLLPNTFVTPALTVLCMRPVKHPCYHSLSCVLTPDAVNEEAYRQLRVALRAQTFLR